MIEEIETKKVVEFLEPTRDCIFKGVMLDPNNPDYIKGFIHFIIGIPYKDLVNVKIENSEYVINNKKDKKMRSDIIVSVDKLYINIEMDREYYKDVIEKNNAYYHKQYAALYNIKEKYSESKALIQICFQDFYYFEENKEIYKFVYKEETSNERLYKNGEDIDAKYFVNLAYIYDICYNKDVSELSDFERYCLLLKTTSKDKSYEISGDDKVMKKVSERLENLSSDDKIIGLYDAEIEEEKIKKTMIDNAREEGIKEGHREGIKDGIIKTAKNLILKNIDIETISEVTGLSVEEIKKL